MEKTLKREHDEDHQLIQILRKLRDGDYKSNLAISSAMDNQITKLATNPDLLEAFYLGMMCMQEKQVKVSEVEEIGATAVSLVESREREIFNKNILTLIEATSIPIHLKQTTASLTDLFDVLDVYYPEKFYPKVHQLKKIVTKLNVDSVDDVIMFNHQFKIIFNHLIDGIKESPLMASVRKVNVQDLIKTKVVPTITRADKIFSKEYNRQKFISLDIRQANSTVFFVHYGLTLFRDKGLTIADMGFGLEKFFNTWDEFIEKFNWSHYVQA